METNKQVPQSQQKEAQKGKMEQLIALLPSDVRSELQKAFTFKELLNQDPPKKWLDKHPVHGGNYLPIDKVELLLDTLFKQWELRVVNYQILINSITVQVELKVVDYEGNERVVHGVGAAPIQVDKGASPIDHTKIKSDSVMKALPSAMSYALKYAAKRLGKIFGRDVEREDAVQFVAPHVLRIDDIVKTLKDNNQSLTEIINKINV
jgi:hypothetical protein